MTLRSRSRSLDPELFVLRHCVATTRITVRYGVTSYSNCFEYRGELRRALYNGTIQHLLPCEVSNYCSSGRYQEVIVGRVTAERFLAVVT